MIIQINKAEAIKLLCLYYGQEVYQKLLPYLFDEGYCIIDIEFLRSIEEGFVQSFRFTSLRMMDEMTEEEVKAAYHLDSHIINSEAVMRSSIESHFTRKCLSIEQVDYLRSIGIYLREIPKGKHIKDITFEII